MATMNTVGARTLRGRLRPVYLPPAICFSKKFEPKNRTAAAIPPDITANDIAHLNILNVFLCSFLTLFSEIILDIARGRLYEDIISITSYISNATE